MFVMTAADPFATKGIEYIVALLFLAGLPLFWQALKPVAKNGLLAAGRSRLAGLWNIPGDLLYHRGHAWARQVAPGVVRVGLDDFAQQLLGPVDAIVLPRVRSRVRRGQMAWEVQARGQQVRLPVPVSGRVLRINRDLARQSDLINEDPYGSGWLMDVQCKSNSVRSLVLDSAEQVMRRLQAFEAGLRQSLSPQLGPVLQDGGALIPGFARSLPLEDWNAVVRDQLRARIVSPPEGMNSHERRD